MSTYSTYYLKDEDTAETLSLGKTGTVDLGLPGRSFSLEETYSDQSIIKGAGFFSGRSMKISKVFIYTQESIKQAFLNFIAKQGFKNVYLYKTNDTFTGRMKIVSAPSGGESFNNVGVSGEVGFTLLSESPYFESTTTTNITVNITDDVEAAHSVTISGLPVACLYTLIPDSGAADFTVFQVARGDGFSFRAVSSFEAGQVIEADTRAGELTLEIDGAFIGNAFTENSSPMVLDSGTQNLLIAAQTGVLTISYKQRQL